MATPVGPPRHHLRPELTELARGLTRSFDAQAGPWRLTEWEWFVQEMCRDQFGLYDPTLLRQIAYIQRLHEGVIVSYIPLDVQDMLYAA